ncbi:LicD family protein [Acidaminococcus timonensis]|uniref:LicD family protein n=1 Tax=Acidaminococcus timonensis TaxID=1871002 RepID=UPI0008DB1C19|nr:LicD family protein [Acidaminococcus timonensis]
MDKKSTILLKEKEIKSRELNILLSFQEFCQKKHLRFYLSGGTLLGAVRHHGFIPWDDDIDVCMPRKDFEKLIDVYPKISQGYQLRAERLGNFSAPFAKIVDTKTVVETQYSTDNINAQLWIDIFPVDGLPESLQQVRHIYKLCGFYRKLFTLADVKLGEGKTTFHKYAKYILKPLARIYGKKRCTKKINELAQQYPYNTCQYVGAITWGLYGVGERMLKSEFEEQVMVEFEGHKFPTFSCWDSYLHGLYGDYMELPPVEKRQTHDMKVYVKE